MTESEGGEGFAGAPEFGEVESGKALVAAEGEGSLEGKIGTAIAQPDGRREPKPLVFGRPFGGQGGRLNSAGDDRLADHLGAAGPPALDPCRPPEPGLSPDCFTAPGKYTVTFEASGTAGAFGWSLEEGQTLQYAARIVDGQKVPGAFGGGFQGIHVTESEHPYGKVNWVPGLAEGYGSTATALYGDWFTTLSGGKAENPDIATVHDAQRIAIVCDAILQSAKTGTRVEIR